MINLKKLVKNLFTVRPKTALGIRKRKRKKITITRDLALYANAENTIIEKIFINFFTFLRNFCSLQVKGD